MISAILDVVSPPPCAGCGRGAWPFCEPCHAALLSVTPPWCVRCGRPTERDVDGCAWCPPPPVSVARAAFVFRGPARSAVLRLKFGGWRTIAEALAAAMVAADPCSAPDAICWVPTSPRRRARRGYDQAAALAAAVGRRLGAPVRPLLVRASDPGPQARRGGAERRAAMVRAFRIAPRASRAPMPAGVLLVDDVLTTGASASACAHVLIEAGARDVDLLTAARAIPGRLPARYTRPGLPFGSVVARGRGSPEVDASRGRNDPRKATLGR
jgi:predicted amidophosphoribosyltransferase